MKVFLTQHSGQEEMWLAIKGGLDMDEDVWDPLVDDEEEEG